MRPMRLAMVVATMWWGPQRACSTSLRGAGDVTENTEDRTPQPPFHLPAVPNLLAFGDVLDDPFAEAPRWLPSATNVTKIEAVEREH